jgi:hypothetical protein
MAPPEHRRPSAPGPESSDRYLEIPTWLGVGVAGALALGVALVALGAFDLFALAAMLAFVVLSALVGLMLRRDDGHNALPVAGARLRAGARTTTRATLATAGAGTARAFGAAMTAGRAGRRWTVSAGRFGRRWTVSAAGNLARSTAALRERTARQWRPGGDSAAPMLGYRVPLAREAGPGRRSPAPVPGTAHPAAHSADDEVVVAGMMDGHVVGRRPRFDDEPHRHWQGGVAERDVVAQRRVRP